MEESNVNDSPTYVIKTASLLLYGLYAVLILLNVNGIYPEQAILALIIVPVFFATTKLMACINLWKNQHLVAYGYLTHEPTSQNLPALNPLLMVNMANTTISAAVTAFLISKGAGSLGSIFAGLIIMAPCIFVPLLYNRLSSLTNNDGIRKLAMEEMSMREIEYKRNVILNEEMTKAMPAIIEKVNERWIEAGLLTEEPDEHNESGESDQGNLTTTVDRD